MKQSLLIILFSFLLSQDCDEGYSYIPVSEIPFSATSLPFNSGQPYTCFNDGDIQFLNELNELNNLNYDSPISLGTQTWNYGRLKVFVATYTPNGSGITTTQIQILPNTISNLSELLTLYLEWNHLTHLPNSFTQLSNLKNLYISNNKIEILNDDFGSLTELKILDAGYNYISNIPDSFINLENLEYLWLFNNDIRYIPNEICNLDIEWSEMDNAYYPYFAIGGNELCFSNSIPECILNSEHLNESLDQFYYSFMYVINQDCPDINQDQSINIFDIVLIANIIVQNDFPDSDTELYNNMDINDDEDINILDLLQLVNWILEN